MSDYAEDWARMHKQAKPRTYSSNYHLQARYLRLLWLKSEFYGGTDDKKSASSTSQMACLSFRFRTKEYLEPE